MTDKTPQQVGYEVDLIKLSLSIVQDHRSLKNEEEVGLTESHTKYVTTEVEKYEATGDIDPSVIQSVSNLFSNFHAQYQSEHKRFTWGTIDDELRRIASESSFQ